MPSSKIQVLTYSKLYVVFYLKNASYPLHACSNHVYCWTIFEKLSRHLVLKLGHYDMAQAVGRLIGKQKERQSLRFSDFGSNLSFFQGNATFLSRLLI